MANTVRTLAELTNLLRDGQVSKSIIPGIFRDFLTSVYPAVVKVPDWYVAPASAQSGIGSDSNDGLSPNTPFATISKAASVAQAGDLVQFASGTYPTNVTTTASGTATDPIIYQSAVRWGAKLTVPASNPSGTLWINGGSGTTGTVGQYVTIDGFEIDLGTYTTGTKPEGGIFATGTGDVVRNCKIHGINNSNTSPSSGAGGIQLDGFYGGSNMSASNNVVYNIVGTGSAVSNYQCIYLATNATVYNNIVGNTSSDGISSYHGANAMLVFNNTIYNCHVGIDVVSGGLGSGSYPVTTGNSNGRFANNVIISCTYGIYENGGTLVNNFFSNNNTYNCTTATNITGMGSTLANNTTTNPVLVNYISTGLGNYKLTASSPAKASGIVTLGSATAPILDFGGNVRSSSAPSLGAYE